jgi:hypothetical protein
MLKGNHSFGAVLVRVRTWQCARLLRSTEQDDKKVVENQNNSSGELKTLAEGSQSSITDPFVAVIRDDATYAKLQKMEPSLPQLETDFFRLNVVVACVPGNAKYWWLQR